MNSPDKKSPVTIKNPDVDIIHSHRTKYQQRYQKLYIFLRKILNNIKKPPRIISKPGQKK